MNVNEVIRNPLLVFPANISEFCSLDRSPFGSDCQLISIPVLVIDRDSNEDRTRQITINVNNNIHVRLPSTEIDEQQSPEDRPNMTINEERIRRDDDDENDNDNDADSTSDGSSQGTSNGSSSNGSQDSVAYATPPASGQLVKTESSPAT